jgi:uncharacterized protein YfiM (DUF2279 family)
VSFPVHWFGADKVKHFLISAFVQSTTYSIARLAGAGRTESHIIGAAATLSVGVMKEVYDLRSKGRFSRGDLFWDAAGTVSAAALLNHTR